MACGVANKQPDLTVEQFRSPGYCDFGGSLSCRCSMPDVFFSYIDLSERVIDLYMGVSKNRGTPKWMVYNGKPY